MLDIDPVVVNENLRILATFYPQFKKRIFIKLSGIWSCNGYKKLLSANSIKKIKFRKNVTSFGSRFHPNGTEKVKTIKIDSLNLKKITYITMDIEGAEFQALKGAEKTIRKHKPDMAISIYHAPRHIVDIPLWINNLKLGYKFFLRNYTSQSIETILYCTCALDSKFNEMT